MRKPNYSGDPRVLPDDGTTPTDWRRVWREFGAGMGVFGAATTGYGAVTLGLRRSRLQSARRAIRRYRLARNRWGKDLVAALHFALRT
jgi:hypothetical protein